MAVSSEPLFQRAVDCGVMSAEELRAALSDCSRGAPGG